MPRREHWSIVGSILEAIDEQSKPGVGEARMTKLALRANISYDRLLLYLREMEGDGLIATANRVPALSEKGTQFLQLFRQWTSTLDEFGIRAMSIPPPERRELVASPPPPQEPAI